MYKPWAILFWLTCCEQFGGGRSFVARYTETGFWFSSICGVILDMPGKCSQEKGTFCGELEILCLLIPFCLVSGSGVRM